MWCKSRCAAAVNKSMRVWKIRILHIKKVADPALRLYSPSPLLHVGSLRRTLPLSVICRWCHPFNTLIGTLVGFLVRIYTQGPSTRVDYVLFHLIIFLLRKLMLWHGVTLSFCPSFTQRSKLDFLGYIFLFSFHLTCQPPDKCRGLEHVIRHSKCPHSRTSSN